jgi:hypothetical protein
LAKIKARIATGNKSGHDILKPILIADGQPLAFSPPAVASRICCSERTESGLSLATGVNRSLSEKERDLRIFLPFVSVIPKDFQRYCLEALRLIGFSS